MLLTTIGAYATIVMSQNIEVTKENYWLDVICSTTIPWEMQRRDWLSDKKAQRIAKLLPGNPVLDATNFERELSNKIFLGSLGTYP